MMNITELHVTSFSLAEADERLRNSEVALVRLSDAIDRISNERDRYRTALERIKAWGQADVGDADARSVIEIAERALNLPVNH